MGINHIDPTSSSKPIQQPQLASLPGTSIVAPSIEPLNDQSPIRQEVHGFNQEALLAAYAALNAQQLDYNERKWETVRSASLIILGILAAVGGIVSGEGGHNKWVLGSVALILVALGIWIRSWIISNVRRES